MPPPTPAHPSPRKHVFVGKKSAHKAAKPAQGFDYPSTKVGTSGPVTVYYQTTLGGSGQALAQQLLGTVQADYDRTWSAFGLTSATAVNLLLADLGGGGTGQGGAYHYGCQGTDLYCDASYGDQATAALFVAELAEVAMALAGKGWDCGASAGEGLSRLVAEVFYPGTLDAYATAPAWLDGSRPDWVDATDPTDGSAESTGCAVLALFWALSQGASLSQVCQAPGSTVAAALAGVGLSAAAFLAAVAQRWPAGSPSGVTTDNPWSGNGGGGGGGGGGDVQVILHIPALDLPCTLTMPTAARAARIDTGALLQLLLQLLHLLLGGQGGPAPPPSVVRR